jgi:hypothetical protein
MDFSTATLFKYYGTDWIAMILTMIAIYMIGNRQRFGFIFMITANVCWLIVGVLTQSFALLVANVVFSTMNIRAFVKWSRK